MWQIETPALRTPAWQIALEDAASPKMTHELATTLVTQEKVTQSDTIGVDHHNLRSVHPGVHRYWDGGLDAPGYVRRATATETAAATPSEPGAPSSPGRRVEGTPAPNEAGPAAQPATDNNDLDRWADEGGAVNDSGIDIGRHWMDATDRVIHLERASTFDGGVVRIPRGAGAVVSSEVMTKTACKRCGQLINNDTICWKCWKSTPTPPLRPTTAADYYPDPITDHPWPLGEAPSGKPGAASPSPSTPSSQAVPPPAEQAVEPYEVDLSGIGTLDAQSPQSLSVPSPLTPAPNALTGGPSSPSSALSSFLRLFHKNRVTVPGFATRSSVGASEGQEHSPAPAVKGEHGLWRLTTTALRDSRPSLKEFLSLWSIREAADLSETKSESDLAYIDPHDMTPGPGTPIPNGGFPIGSHKDASEHALWWSPGERGRGFIAPDGSVHTWPEEDAAHYPMANAKGLPWNQMYHTTFYIRPTGDVHWTYGKDVKDLWHKPYEADPRLRTIEPTNFYGSHKESKETYPQTARRWETLGPLQHSDLVHTFPDGHTIHRLHTYGDVGRVGLQLVNCWKGRASFSNPAQPINQPEDEWSTNTPMHYMSLHDPNDVPQVGFYVHDNKVQEGFGARNKRPQPMHLQMLKDYAAMNGHGFEEPDYDHPIYQEYHFGEPAPAIPAEHIGATIPQSGDQFVVNDINEEGPGDLHGQTVTYERRDRNYTGAHYVTDHNGNTRWVTSDMLGLPNMLFHQAPTEERARIKQHGLQVADPTIRSPWILDAAPWTEHERGVHTVPHPGDLETLRTYKEFNKPYDIWAMPAAGLEAKPDPAFGNGIVIPHTVDPDKLELHQRWETTPEAEEFWPKRGVTETVNEPVIEPVVAFKERTTRKIIVRRDQDGRIASIDSDDGLRSLLVNRDPDGRILEIEEVS